MPKKGNWWIAIGLLVALIGLVLPIFTRSLAVTYLLFFGAPFLGMLIIFVPFIWAARRTNPSQSSDII